MEHWEFTLVLTNTEELMQHQFQIPAEIVIALQTAHNTERKIVGIDGKGSLGDAEATKSKKRKRPTAAD